MGKYHTQFEFVLFINHAFVAGGPTNKVFSTKSVPCADMDRSVDFCTILWKRHSVCRLHGRSFISSASNSKWFCAQCERVDIKRGFSDGDLFHLLHRGRPRKVQYKVNIFLVGISVHVSKWQMRTTLWIHAVEFERFFAVECHSNKICTEHDERAKRRNNRNGNWFQWRDICIPNVILHCDEVKCHIFLNRSFVRSFVLFALFQLLLFVFQFVTD